MGVGQTPRVRAVTNENIPDILKQLDRWVVWRAGALKASGKFDKVPVDPLRGRMVSALEPSNWLSYDQAFAAYQKGVGSGVGIVLSSDHPLLVDGTPYFLTALDFDNCRERLDRLKALWVQLGQPYVEESPSGNGLRMFGLSRSPLRGGNAGDGREVYSSGRFMTGGDENSSIDMTKAIRNADIVGGIVEGPVLLVHHSGKDLGKGLRGHTSLLGAVATSIEVGNNSGTRSFTIRKNKDGPDGQSQYFELVSYAVGKDQWGDEVRSCAVRQLLTKPSPALPQLTGRNQLAIVAALRSTIATTGAPIDWQSALSCAASALVALPNSRRVATAKETLSRLRESGHVLFNEEGVSLP